MAEGKVESGTKSLALAKSNSTNWKPFDMSELSYEIVTLSVPGINGAASKKFSVHKNLACHHSPVFAAAFIGGFAESISQTMELNDTTANAVATLIRWMYSGSFRVADDNGSPDWTSGFELWLLADKLLIPQPQNLCVAGILEAQAATSRVPVGFAPRVYQETLSGSPLRKLLVDQAVDCVRAENFLNRVVNNAAWYPLEYVIDIAVALKAKHNNGGTKSLVGRSSIYMVPVPGEGGKDTT